MIVHNTSPSISGLTPGNSVSHLIVAQRRQFYVSNCLIIINNSLDCDFRKPKMFALSMLSGHCSKRNVLYIIKLIEIVFLYINEHIKQAASGQRSSSKSDVLLSKRVVLYTICVQTLSRVNFRSNCYYQNRLNQAQTEYMSGFTHSSRLFHLQKC